LRKKGKSKHILNYPRGSKTRATNELRLNSKALFQPAIKNFFLIILDDDWEENTKEGKEQLWVTSSNKLKEVNLEPEEEHYNELVEKQRNNENGKQIAEHQMRHVTKVTKNLGLNYEYLSKSSLKRDYLAILKENIDKTQIKQDFEYIPEVE